jgi:uncharacterized protein YndB with AHSA1/START domain
MTTKSNMPCVVVKKVIKASQEAVFDAWTKPELMNKWYVGGPGTATVTVDLRVGGSYTNTMHITEGADKGCGATTGCTSPTADYLHTGKYLEIDRPKRLVFTWDSPHVTNSKVTVELKAVGNGTEVTITHELPEERHCEGHRGGWTFALENLERFLQ